MKKLTLITALLLVFTAMAQQGAIGMVDAYSTGFGKTYTINSRGVYSLGINPANLALSAPKEYEVSLPPNLGLRVGTDFLSIDEFNYFFGGVDNNGSKVGRYLTTEDKQRMVDLFRNGGTVSVDLYLQLFAVAANLGQSIGSIGFSVQDVFYTKFKFPSGVIDLLMNGNPEGSVYDLNDMKFKATYYRTYNISYAREVKLLPKWFKTATVGVGIKFINGYAYAGIDHINASITTNSDKTITAIGNGSTLTSFSPDFGVKYDFDSLSPDKSTSISAFPKSAGTGTGFDIGFSGIINDKWSVGLAITDIGKITWDQNAAEYASNSNFTLTDVSDKNLRDSLTKAFKGEGHSISSFTTDLPTAFRLGASYIVKPGLWRLTADLNIGLNDAPRNEKGTRFSVGGEWNPLKWLPYLRGGLSFGGLDYFSWTVGIGLNIWRFEMNFATPDFQYIFTPKDGKRVSFAGGWRLKLGS